MSQIALIKHSFFNEVPSHLKKFSFRREDFNLTELNFEFSSIYQVVISNSAFLSNKIELILYLNYLCELLIHYYQCDFVNAEFLAFKKKKKEIDLILQADQSLEKKIANLRCTALIYNSIKSKSYRTIHSFNHIAKIRGHISWIMSNLSYWNYSRSLASQLISYLKNKDLIFYLEEINERMGHYRPEDFLKFLEDLKPLLRLVNLILYACRLIIYLTTLVKHLIQATLNKELSSKKVLQQEIEKRGDLILSDGIWGGVLLLNNYRGMLGISSLRISQLNFIFLITDILLIAVKWLYEMKQYDNFVKELRLQKSESSSFERLVINRQLDIIKDEWSAQQTYYIVNLIAGHLLLVAFVVSLFISSSVFLIALAVLNNVGNTLYTSSDDYKKYKQAKIAIQREITNGELSNESHHQELLVQLKKECKEAHALFWKKFILNATAASLIITAAALSWPVACLLATSFIALNVYSNYHEAKPIDSAKKVAHDPYRLFNHKKTSASVKALQELENQNAWQITVN